MNLNKKFEKVEKLIISLQENSNEFEKLASEEAGKRIKNLIDK